MSCRAGIGASGVVAPCRATQDGSNPPERPPSAAGPALTALEVLPIEYNAVKLGPGTVIAVEALRQMLEQKR